MAERALLHKRKLNDFIQWLIADGWTTEPIKGEYEILRAWKPDHKYPLIVYDRNNGNQLCKIRYDDEKHIIEIFGS